MSTNKEVLQILNLEDNPQDSELLRMTLETAGMPCVVKRVDTRNAYLDALKQGGIDLIASDYSIPSFDGGAALTLAHERCPDVPFIFVSGTIGEEVAIESLKLGATDYVLKGRLSRLASAVERACRAARERAERHRIEERIREQADLLEQAPDAICVTDLDQRIIYWNRGAERLYAWPATTALGRNVDELLWAGDATVSLWALKGLIARGEWHGEWKQMTQYGQPIFVESRWKLTRTGAGKPKSILVINTDITARKLAETKVWEQAALLEKAQDAIFVRDLDQRITYWNRGAERVYGWTTEEALGKRADALLNPDDAPEPAETSEVLIERGEWAGEQRHFTKAGKVIIVQSRRNLLFDPDGKPSAVLNIDTNITEQKEMEAQFLRAQRIESIGALAGGIVHDLNNVLSPILMLSDLLRTQVTDEAGKRVLDLLETSAKRGSELVKQILSFARGVDGEQIPLDAGHLIDEVATLIKGTFPKSIKLLTEIDSNLPPILANATQLHQVVLNLCLNARDAMPEGGSIRVKAECVALEGRLTRMQDQPVSGAYVLVTVADSGAGIQPEDLGRIFEPFFTTKAMGTGTGLGLSTVMSIVKSHRGFVEVTSQCGEGTKFEVFFPAVVAANA